MDKIQFTLQVKREHVHTQCNSVTKGRMEEVIDLQCLHTNARITPSTMAIEDRLENVGDYLQERVAHLRGRGETDLRSAQY